MYLNVKIIFIIKNNKSNQFMNQNSYKLCIIYARSGFDFCTPSKFMKQNQLYLKTIMLQLNILNSIILVQNQF